MLLYCLPFKERHSMIELVFRFPEQPQDAVSRIDFQRTLRLLDDNQEYPLPPDLL